VPSRIVFKDLLRHDDGRFGNHDEDATRALAAGGEQSVYLWYATK
jgi:hypothetical protein